MTMVTLDPSVGTGTLSNGDLTLTIGNGARPSTEMKSSGKWYLEMEAVSGGAMGFFIGRSGMNYGTGASTDINQFYYGQTGGIGGGAYSNAQYGKAWVVGDIIGLSLDLDVGEAVFYVNGESQGILPFNLKTQFSYPINVGARGSSGTGTRTMTMNFGATPFKYNIPKGYYSYDGSQYGGQNKFLISADEKLYSYSDFSTNMKRYGVSWFKFDEISGNVIDSKGNALGIINGGVTRVTGWNGQGNALSFNGSNSHVQLDQKVIPIGKKSIRFKFKRNGIPSNSEIIMDNCNWTSSSQGWSIRVIASSGGIAFSRTSGTTGPDAISIHSTKNVCDNQWHDILFTWDGTTNTNTVKLYVDNMFSEIVSSTASSIETQVASYNLRLGYAANNNTVTYRFRGEIDNFEVYNDVILPNFRMIELTKSTIENFITYGLENSEEINLVAEITESQYIKDSSVPLGAGKVFKQTINTSKTSIRKVRIE